MTDDVPDLDGSEASALEDSVTDFAADLRALRLNADSPTLSRLQNETGVSKSVLSSALGGKQLPSARTVNRLVKALGADTAPWVQRRDALATTGVASLSADSIERLRLSPSTQHLVTPSVEPSSRRSSSLRPALALSLAFLLGIVVASAISWGVTAAAVTQARDDGAAAARRALMQEPISSHAQINVSNGVDPALSPCVNDAKVATASNRTNNTKLEIIWSNKCYAGWARITRYDEKFSGNSMTVSIYPETAAQGPDRQSATEPNVQSAYTTLVVRPTPETRLCAVGSITLAGESIDLGEPLCT
ncbi:DUF2690 domain-containing protein [Microbacterium suwonense]|uniref:DUF2690 domain-containing protein n=1 Tax=Microbacterium suwonense TaxID=683047 RepID=UPI003618A94B